jgi:hypothetical protein
MSKFNLDQVAKECNQSISVLANYLKNNGLGLEMILPNTILNLKQYKICIENFKPNYVQRTNYVSIKKKRSVVNNVSKCKVCHCDLNHNPPRIHDCRIKNLWDYKNSRYLSKDQLEILMVEFNIQRETQKIEAQKIKEIDRYVLNNIFYDSKTILTNENKLNTDIKTINRIIEGSVKEVKNLSFDHLNVESFFTNEEVVHLAFGVKEAVLSRIARKYFKGIKLTSEEWVLLHNSMMRAARDLGKDQLLSLLELNSIDFRSTSSLIVFDMLKKLSFHDEKQPSFRINFNGHSYVCQYVTENNRINKDVFQVSKLSGSNTTNYIFRIDRKGKIRLKSDLEIRATFQLIQAFCNDSKQLIIGYGMKEGRCSICNNLLTDNISKLKGIGPICERNIFGNS